MFIAYRMSQWRNYLGVIFSDIVLVGSHKNRSLLFFCIVPLSVAGNDVMAGLVLVRTMSLRVCLNASNHYQNVFS
jgi:hypothetical protein